MEHVNLLLILYILHSFIFNVISSASNNFFIIVKMYRYCQIASNFSYKCKVIMVYANLLLLY